MNRLVFANPQGRSDQGLPRVAVMTSLQTMNATMPLRRYRAAAPPGLKRKTHVGQDVGFEKLQSNGRAKQTNDTTLIRWTAYAARRRLRRKRLCSYLPTEVVQ